MAAPSVTYTFANSTTSDATQVNTNFSDIINGVSDGTKDLSINALTCAGTATLNGNVNLGNASGDDLTITASLASSLAIKTTATYNIGSATLGILSLYIGNSTFTTRLLSAATSSWTLTLPVTGGTSGYFMQTNGSGTATWADVVTTTTSSAALTGLTSPPTVAIRTTVIGTTTGSIVTITVPALPSLYTKSGNGAIGLPTIAASYRPTANVVVSQPTVINNVYALNAFVIGSDGSFNMYNGSGRSNIADSTTNCGWDVALAFTFCKT